MVYLFYQFCTLFFINYHDSEPFCPFYLSIPAKSLVLKVMKYDDF